MNLLIAILLLIVAIAAVIRVVRARSEQWQASEQPSLDELENESDMVRERVTIPEYLVHVICRKRQVGDHRDGSSDSRHWGFLPRRNILGTQSYVIHGNHEACLEPALQGKR